MTDAERLARYTDLLNRDWPDTTALTRQIPGRRTSISAGDG